MFVLETSPAARRSPAASRSPATTWRGTSPGKAWRVPLRDESRRTTSPATTWRGTSPGKAWASPAASRSPAARRVPLRLGAGRVPARRGESRREQESRYDLARDESRQGVASPGASTPSPERAEVRPKSYSSESPSYSRVPMNALNLTRRPDGLGEQIPNRRVHQVPGPARTARVGSRSHRELEESKGDSKKRPSPGRTRPSTHRAVPSPHECLELDSAARRLGGANPKPPRTPSPRSGAHGPGWKSQSWRTRRIAKGHPEE